MNKEIEVLITKAAKATISTEAMHYSQAAVNCANAVAILNTSPPRK